MTLSERWPVPSWLEKELPGEPLADDQARMRLAIRLAARNLEERTGSPFAAVIVERPSGRIVSAGVDLVLATACSVAHAETTAIARAQGATGTADLRGVGDLALYASATPCLMCLGAIRWSGVSTLAYAARDEDWNQHWDDLAKPADWHGRLEERGVTVIPELLRDEARESLEVFIGS
jgi:tRNA(Arg) A34 adenosine deaminase TadA